MSKQSLILFLQEASKYFANRPVNGEDRAHWSNVFNSENCTKAADELDKSIRKDEVLRLIKLQLKRVRNQSSYYSGWDDALDILSDTIEKL